METITPAMYKSPLKFVESWDRLTRGEEPLKPDIGIGFAQFTSFLGAYGGNPPQTDLREYLGNNEITNAIDPFIHEHIRLFARFYGINVQTTLRISLYMFAPRAYYCSMVNFSNSEFSELLKLTNCSIAESLAWACVIYARLRANRRSLSTRPRSWFARAVLNACKASGKVLLNNTGMLNPAQNYKTLNRIVELLGHRLSGD